MTVPIQLLLQPLRRSDIRGPALYESFRDDFRKRVIELKKPRRVSVGDRVTLVFENRHTLLFQVEEMLRAESLTTDPQIEAELAVYNALMPTADSLSATLFIELPPDSNAREELDTLIGLDEHVVLHIGKHAIRANFEAGRSTQDRISAVQYTRFALTEAAKLSMARPHTPLAIEIDHPRYRHRTPMDEDSRESLAADYLDS